jgi:zinc protease
MNRSQTHATWPASLLILAACTGGTPAPVVAPGVTTSTITAAPVVAPSPARVVPYVEGNGRVIERHIAGTDAVAIQVLYYTGSIDDPPGKEGLTALSARLVAEGGSVATSYPALLTKLYPLATSIDARVDKEQASFSMLVHKDHVALVAPILGEILTTPRLGEADLERLRAEALNAIEKRLRTTDDENLGKAVLNQVLYPAGHPYHHLVTGTVEGLRSITTADVRAHVAKVFGKARLVIGLAGAVDGASRDVLVRALDALPVGEPRRALVPPAPPLTRTQVVIAQKPAKAVAISMGHPHGAFRGHPDFAALALVQSYFGEHRQFHGVLMSELRERRGLNYGDYAYVENFIQEGWSRYVQTNIARRQQHFEVWLRPVDPKDTLFATRLALFLRSQLIAEGVSAQGLEDTRQFLAGYTRLWELTPLRRLGWTLDDDFYGTTAHLDALRAALPGLTEASVDAAIQAHLASPALAIVMVAEDAAGLKAALLAGAPSPKAYDSAPPSGVPELDAKVVSLPLGLTDADIRIVPVSELFVR